MPAGSEIPSKIPRASSNIMRSSIVDYLYEREWNGRCRRSVAVDSCIAAAVPFILAKERDHKLAIVGKIMSSAWLDSERILIGTTRNEGSRLLKGDIVPQLIELHSTTGTVQSVERPGNHVTPEDEFNCVSTIAVDRQRRHLLTTGVKSDTLALYSMSNMSLLSSGSTISRKEQIKSVAWIGDKLVVSVSRSSHLTLWDLISGSIKPRPPFAAGSTRPISLSYLVYNDQRKEVCAVAKNNVISLWDVATFQPRIVKVPGVNNCVMSCDEGGYVIGQDDGLVLVDVRTAGVIKRLAVPPIVDIPHGPVVNRIEVLSLDTRAAITAVGTGIKKVFFFDLRAARFHRQEETGITPILETGCTCYYVQDEERHVMMDYASAVATVKYDETGTKLFIGGGPRRAGVPGHYAGIWGFGH